MERTSSVLKLPKLEEDMFVIKSEAGKAKLKVKIKVKIKLKKAS